MYYNALQMYYYNVITCRKLHVCFQIDSLFFQLKLKYNVSKLTTVPFDPLDRRKRIAASPKTVCEFSLE